MAELLIQRCLGRGGFGEVYRGTMSRGGGVEVEVAIKILRADLDPASQGIQRLRDEGRLLGRLTHPTILRVYDLVVINGRAALVSEYVGGADLGRLLREVHIPARCVFECTAQVAAALDAAWSWPSVTDGKPLHLVHRDIKPDNIRIDPHGVVKLLDFGIAQAQTVAREAQTSVNTIMGSTQYLAPERLVQQEVGPESDVFALGCTMFEALVGEALFARRSMRQMYLLMVDERRFDQFVAERAGAHRDRLGGERAVALFRAMTAWRKQARPTAAEVAARCDQISDSTDGPSLTQWCRGRDWPAEIAVAGPLDGMRFSTSHVSVLAEGADAGAEAAEPLRPPAAAPDSARRRPPPALEPSNGVPRQRVLGESTTTALTLEREARSLFEHAVPWSAAELVAVMATKPEPGLRIPQLVRQTPDLGAETPRSARAPAPAAVLEPVLIAAATDERVVPNPVAPDAVGREEARPAPVPDPAATPAPAPEAAAPEVRPAAAEAYDPEIAPTVLILPGLAFAGLVRPGAPAEAPASGVPAPVAPAQLPAAELPEVPAAEVPAADGPAAEAQAPRAPEPATEPLGPQPPLPDDDAPAARAPRAQDTQEVRPPEPTDPAPFEDAPTTRVVVTPAPGMPAPEAPSASAPEVPSASAPEVPSAAAPPHEDSAEDDSAEDDSADDDSADDDSEDPEEGPTEVKLLPALIEPPPPAPAEAPPPVLAPIAADPVSLTPAPAPAGAERAVASGSVPEPGPIEPDPLSPASGDREGAATTPAEPAEPAEPPAPAPAAEAPAARRPARPPALPALSPQLVALSSLGGLLIGALGLGLVLVVALLVT